MARQGFYLLAIALITMFFAFHSTSRRHGKATLLFVAEWRLSFCSSPSLIIFLARWYVGKHSHQYILHVEQTFVAPRVVGFVFSICPRLRLGPFNNQDCSRRGKCNGQVKRYLVAY